MWISTLFSCLTLAVLTSGTEVTLSSNLLEQAGNGIVCVGKSVTLECSGSDISVMRWIMEPFIENTNPVSFNLISNEGCLSRVSGIFEICLTSIILTPDGSLADMTSTLNFSSMNTINGVPLDGTVVMCNEESTTLVVIKDPPPPISGLNCTATCNDLNSTILCTWAPLPEEYYIRSYHFNISVATEMPENSLTLEQKANESIEFSLLCKWTAVKVMAFRVNECGISGNTTSANVSGSCICSANDSEVGKSLAPLVLLCLIPVVVIAILLGVLYAVYKQNKDRKFTPNTDGDSTDREPTIQTEIRWEKCETDIPITMSHMHVVMIDNKLYCGGGYAESREKANTIYMCKLNQESIPEEWRELRGHCPVIKFALTHYTIEGEVKLVTVGGRKYMTKNAVADLYVHSTEDDDKDWQTDPRMCSLPENIYYIVAHNYRGTDTSNDREYIIAYGGILPTQKDNDDFHNSIYRCSDTVVIYDGNNWRSVSQLPMKRHCLSLASVGHKVYVVGGAEGGEVKNDAAVFDCLTRECESIEPCPLAGSTAVAIGDKLLVIGGKNIGEPDSEAKQSVYVFSNAKWKEVQVKGDVPSFYMATAKGLSDNKFIMIGGQQKRNSPMDSVYIGKIELFEIPTV